MLKRWRRWSRFGFHWRFLAGAAADASTAMAPFFVREDLCMLVDCL
jgi:hypothetical protein